MVTHVNVGLIVEDLLVNTYGFEPIREVEKGNFWIRRMDSQHSLRVVVDGWQDGRGSRERGGVNLHAYFAVIREDMNDVWRATMHPDLPWFFRTIAEDPRFFGQDSFISGVSGTAEDAAQWVHTYVPRLIEEAPNLPFIEAHIEAKKAVHDVERFGPLPVAIVQALVRGWAEADEDLVAPWVNVIETKPPDHDWRVRLEAQMARMRAWIEAHPDGLVDRELTGR